MEHRLNILEEHEKNIKNFKPEYSYKFTSNMYKDKINFDSLFNFNKIDINDDLSVVEACKKLIQECNFNYIITKKGDKGMTIVGKDNFVKHIEAHFVKNSDVAGAGDSVIAAFSLSYTKTKNIEISAKFANAAAAVVVGKMGTATVTIDEINNYISNNE